MTEVVTLLTSVSGHALVKSFSGTDVIQQLKNGCINARPPTVTSTSRRITQAVPPASLYTPWTEAEVLAHLTTGWGEGAITELKLEYLYGPEPEVSGERYR